MKVSLKIFLVVALCLFSVDIMSQGVKVFTKDGKTHDFPYESLDSIVVYDSSSNETPMSTCAEVLAGADGQTYRIKGTCTKIINTLYGNWYINDGTGEVYVYGTLDSNGAPKNFASLGIEIGDVVELEGPKDTYGTTVELVDVTIINITKSLVTVVSEEVTLGKDGGALEVKVAFRDDEVNASVAKECQDWISLVNTEYIEGVATETESNPADTAVFTFNVMANEKAVRTGSIVFTSGTSEVTYNFTQEHNPNVTIAEFLAAQVGDAQYRVTGVVTEIADTKYGNLYVSDWTGKVYVYGTTNYTGCDIAVGSIVTLVGPRAEYKGDAQMRKAVCEEVLASSTPVSIAEFNALEDSNDKFYMVSGTVTKFNGDLKYGNTYITDETGAEMYIYGTYGVWNAQGDDKYNFVEKSGLAVGDKITVVGIKTSYKGAPQMKNGCCVAIEKTQ